MKFIYKNVFLVASILHAGNGVEYFRAKTHNLVVFYFLGTLRDERDFIEIYRNGVLKSKKIIVAPRIPLIYHASIYFSYISALIKYFDKNDKVYVVTFHPLFFLFNKVVQIWRNTVMVFWIADILPKPSSLFLKAYQNLIFYYHKRSKINFYLGNKLNKLMNGTVNNTSDSKTVMWGIKLEGRRTGDIKVKTKELEHKTGKVVLGFIGVVRKGHGLALAFKLLRERKDISIKILGECDPALYIHYQLMIERYGIKDRVRFENRFYTIEELKSELSSCALGIALYNTSKNDPIYYTDPGKIKTYTQFGLPIIMTNTSEIVPFIKEFRAGEITDATVESLYANVIKIKKNYSKYLEGVREFNNYFEYKKYYDRAFVVLRD